MKSSQKIIAISSLVIASTIAPLSQAMETEAKQGASFFTSTILGAVVGGPVGFMLGAIGGAYMGEQIKKADALEDQKGLLNGAEVALSKSQETIARLEQELLAAENEVVDMQQLAVDNLKFQVLFKTGQDELSARGKNKVQALANFLKQSPDLLVRLNGHADPRGTDKYNNVLSDFRAQNVESDLVAAGIEANRIERQAHGAQASIAPKGDLEAYAMERRVNIEIINPTLQQDLALH